VDISDLPRYLFRQSLSGTEQAPGTLKRVQTSAEQDALRQALKAAGYNKAKAAKMLGIHRSLFTRS
jgi:transcriptional regulator with PAS, ATPase and Fis domain